MLGFEPSAVRIHGNLIEVFHKDPGTGIKLYDVKMEGISGQSPYGLFRTLLINLLRKHSGFGARVNQDALDGFRGSAAMIDYLIRFEEHLNGKLDVKLMRGNTDAVRSRVRIIQDELFLLAKSCLDKKGSFHLFEAGPGYVRTQMNLIYRLRQADYDLTNVHIMGADLHPGVVKVAQEIIRYEELTDIIEVHAGHAGDWIKKLDQKFDVVLAEGVFEYNNMSRSLDLAKTFNQFLNPGGSLIASATHEVPKKAIVEFLDILVLSRTESDFIDIYKQSGFNDPRLITTSPKNISVGIGQTI